MPARVAFTRLLATPVPQRSTTLTNLARLVGFLFAMEVITGLLLALYYRPSPDAAFESVKFISNSVTFGWLVRSVHHMAGNGLVAVAGFIVVRAYFKRAFLKATGPSWWVMAVLIFFFGIGFIFTGNALRWDQAAYWRLVMHGNLAEEVPVVGEWIAGLLRGGELVGGTTLARLYAVHVVVLPWLTFWGLVRARRLRRRGGIR